MLNYKGYTGQVEYDHEAGLLHGEVLDTRDVITFQGRSVDEVEAAFRESVDDYLAFCAERGESPDRPFSGRIMLRLPSDLHREAHIRAQREGKSLNQFVAERLRQAVSS